MFLGLIFLVVVAWSIRRKCMQKRIDEAPKQETVMVEEIERNADKIDEGNFLKQPQYKWAALKDVQI